MRGSQSALLTTAMASQFQFTPLHERQHSVNLSCTPSTNFNSRLYMRGSAASDATDKLKDKFQFTPLHERQLALQKLLYICKHLFQFTPLHERQLQKYTIFSIKSTQFSTKPCFFIVTSRKVVFFSIPVQYFL